MENKDIKQIAVIGTGYVGLVAASIFSSNEVSVIAVDIDTKKVEKLNKGEIPLSEDGVLELVQSSTKKGFLRFSTDIKSAIKESDVIFIAVGTPFNDVTCETDMSSVHNILDVIIETAEQKKIIINKSTAPIGTIKSLQKRIEDAGKENILSVLANPEFLSQGTAVKDFSEAKRVVIGARASQIEDAKILSSLYERFVAKEKIIITSPETAEISKYAANSFLACKVGFINEIALIADKYSANIKDISHIMGLDSRIGDKFLNAGPGYGGSCFPKDLKALEKTAQNSGLDLQIISAVNTSNEKTINYLAQKISNFVALNNLTRITIWGLAFKAGTDDVRDSQPIKIIQNLALETNCEICCYDKVAGNNAARILGDSVIYAKSIEESLRDSELLVILTEWNEFREFPFEGIKKQMKKANVFDFRNIISMQAAKNAGINFFNFANPN